MWDSEKAMLNTELAMVETGILPFSAATSLGRKYTAFNPPFPDFPDLMGFWVN